MNTQTLSQTAIRIEIDIIRHNNFYFYNRRENGRSIVVGKPITSQRASDGD